MFLFFHFCYPSWQIWAILKIYIYHSVWWNKRVRNIKKCDILQGRHVCPPLVHEIQVIIFHSLLIKKKEHNKKKTAFLLVQHVCRKHNIWPCACIKYLWVLYCFLPLLFSTESPKHEQSQWLPLGFGNNNKSLSSLCSACAISSYKYLFVFRGESLVSVLVFALRDHFSLFKKVFMMYLFIASNIHVRSCKCSVDLSVWYKSFCCFFMLMTAVDGVLWWSYWWSDRVCVPVLGLMFRVE